MSYNALQHLQGLFCPRGEDERVCTAPAEITIEDLPSDWRVCFDERAAMMEHDACLPRERAETLALADTIRAMERESTAMGHTKTLPDDPLDARG